MESICRGNTGKSILMGKVNGAMPPKKVVGPCLSGLEPGVEGNLSGMLLSFVWLKCCGGQEWAKTPMGGHVVSLGQMEVKRGGRDILPWQPGRLHVLGVISTNVVRLM